MSIVLGSTSAPKWMTIIYMYMLQPIMHHSLAANKISDTKNPCGILSFIDWLDKQTQTNW